MTVAAVRSPAEYEERLRTYLFERAEEVRAVRVGEKEVSERAAIVAAYADLFSREQLDALRSAEQQAEGDEARASLPPAQGVRGGRRRPGALRAAGRSSRTRSSPRGSRSRARRSRSGRRRPSSPSCRSTRDREELGDLNGDASAGFNEGRRELMRDENELAAELSGMVDPVERNEEEKGISIRALAEQLRVASAESADGVRQAPRPLVRALARPRARSRFPPRTTWRTCAGSPRSRRRTRRSARSRSAWTRSPSSASTSPTRRASGSTSTTARRSLRAPA